MEHKQSIKKLESHINNLKGHLQENYSGSKPINVTVDNGIISPNFDNDLGNALDNLNIASKFKQVISKCKSATVKSIFESNEASFNNSIQSIVSNIGFKQNADFCKQELVDVQNKLESRVVYNLTNSELSEKSENLLKFGQGFTPQFKFGKKKGTSLFNKDVTSIIQSSYKSLTGLDVKLNRNSLIRDTINLATNPKLSQEGSEFLFNIIENKDEVLDSFHKNIKIKINSHLSKFVLNESEIRELFEDSDNQITQTDKNLGFIKISNEELINQFDKINKKQHFIPANISESEYLEEIKYQKKHIYSIMPDRAKFKLEPHLLQNLQKTNFKEQCIGVLRLLPKLGKLKYPDVSCIKDLTSRGIKSSIQDPINDISEILASLSKEVFQNLASYFEKEFNMRCPVVLGSKETSEILKNETVQSDDWCNSVKLSGDMTDMYSNANVNIVIEAYKFAFSLMDISIEEQAFLIILIETVMKYNYFWEPTGIFTMIGGFAMGCHSSAICTDILLLTKEIKMFQKLKQQNLLHTIKRYLRFRDDTNSKIKGTKQEILQVSSILLLGYPKEIGYNVQIFFSRNEFLDFRFITIPSKSNHLISINRKKETKFDISRGNSYTNPSYLKAPLYNAAYSILRNTNNKFNRLHEKKVFEIILSKRGHNLTKFYLAYKRARAKVSKNGKRPFFKGKYSGKIMYDSFTGMHRFILKLFRISKPPKSLNTPVIVGYKKTLNYVFTKKAFFKKLTNHLKK